jgi:hypothetical protein
MFTKWMRMPSEPLDMFTIMSLYGKAISLKSGGRLDGKLRRTKAGLEKAFAF